MKTVKSGTAIIAEPKRTAQKGEPMSDLISRQDAISMKFSHGINEDGVLYVPYREVKTNLEELPSVKQDLITWLLDEIWDEDMWELNWQAFPELLCRKLEKLGYVKRKGDEYERLDQQTGG